MIGLYHVNGSVVGFGERDVMVKLPQDPAPIWPGGTLGAKDPFVETRAQLREAEQLRLSGQIDKAMALCERLVRQYPRYMGALHTLGMLYSDKRDYPRALGFLVRAVMRNPRDWRALTALSNVYLKLDAPEMAAQVLETARRLKPRDAGVLATLGEIYYQQREYEAAADAFRAANSLDKTIWEAEMRLGQCCVHLGQYEEAAAALENVARRRPAFVSALLWLPELPPGLIKSSYLSWIDKAAKGRRAGKADRDGTDFKSSILFARAGVLDKLGRHGEAWDDLVAGNRMLFDLTRDECLETQRVQQKLLERTRSRKVSVRGGTPGRGRNAVSLFILGPSRSGKTTLEELISRLEGVKRGYENPIAENAVLHALQSDGYLDSEMYDYLPQGCEMSCRELYLGDLAERAGSASVFTNTHPGRIVDAARIAAIIPNVRFVFVKRDLDDLTVRIFMKKYGDGFPFSYDIAAIRDYLRWYNNMIDVLSEKLPESSLIVQYEDMVANPTAILNSVAALCGLPSSDTVPEIGDDRGCAAPYREFLAAWQDG